MTLPPRLSVVTHDIALHCEDDLGRPMAFMASFCYQPDDPYAVSLTFHVPAGEVSWVVARSLLHRGLTEPAGEGDVRLWPDLDEQAHAVVRMAFHSPDSQLLVQVRSSELLTFLILTWEAVAAGAEAGQVDLDDLVASLLA